MSNVKQKATFGATKRSLRRSVKTEVTQMSTWYFESGLNPVDKQPPNFSTPHNSFM